jgi:hypothetical protein
LAKWELLLVEDHVTGGVDAAGGAVVASISTVIGRVADEGAWHRARHELVSRRRHHVREAERAEHAEVIVGGWYPKEELEG